MGREITALRRLARAWGGDLKEVSDQAWEGLQATTRNNVNSVTRHRPIQDFFEAPFTGKSIGVHWPSRSVVYNGELVWTDVIHEMGHAFASPDNPDSCEEWDFFGWEYSLVKRIRGDMQTWFASNKDYVIGGDRGMEFGDLSPKRREVILDSRVNHAKKLGLLDSRLQPKPVPRVFDPGKIQIMLDENLKRFTKYAGDNIQGKKVSGNDFEILFKSVGYAEGYERATQDTLRMLQQMTVAPLKVKVPKTK